VTVEGATVVVVVDEVATVVDVVLEVVVLPLTTVVDVAVPELVVVALLPGVVIRARTRTPITTATTTTATALRGCEFRGPREAGPGVPGSPASPGGNVLLIRCSPIVPAASRRHPHHRPSPALPGAAEPAHNERVIGLGILVGDQFAEQLVVAGERHAETSPDDLALCAPFKPPTTLDVENGPVTFTQCHSANPAT
jgi:hypothetical protein